MADLFLFPGVEDWHRVYSIDNDRCNQGLRLRHGNAVKTFPMDIVSNKPFDEKEFNRYMVTCEADKFPKPTLEDVETKREDFKRTKTYTLSNQEVEHMLSKKRQVQGPQYWSLSERSKLIAELEMARQEGDFARERELAEILENSSKPTQESESDKQMRALAELNQRNRERDIEEARQLEIKAIKDKQRAALLARSKSSGDLAEEQTDEQLNSVTYVDILRAANNKLNIHFDLSLLV